MAKPISRTLFDLLGIGTRLAITRVHSTELSWWSDLDGDILGTVILDHTDQDYGWIMLVKDGAGRFRCVDVEASLSTERLAEAKLRSAITKKSRDPKFTGFELQGNEPNRTLDLFEDRGVADARLHPFYLELRDRPARRPAKKVIEAISPWLLSFDTNLVKEFQEGQFNQRLWEVYLWAMFRDQGYDVEHQEAPDLIVSSPWFKFAVEATTIAPSTSGALSEHPNPTSPEELAEFLSDYMPMKFGSSLTSKLNKTNANGRHYWELPGIDDVPFAIAIADFHKEADGETLGSMTFSQSGLYPYLYGTRVSVEVRNGQILFRNEPVTEHTYNGKTVPSGFFDLPKAENISAVIFSNAGTIAKFDRIGVLAGFAARMHLYYRTGYRFDPDPAALHGIPFNEDVSNPDYEEYWGDEVQVFHNPRAIRPLPPDAFPDAAHFFYSDGKLSTIDREGRVLGSMTTVIRITGIDDKLANDEDTILL